jgi:RNA polymerase sigma factor (sigma-70 family)
VGAVSLSREQEQALFAAGDRSAVVVAHIPLAHKFARRYARNNSVRYADYLQAGCIGLIEASERFDPASGNRFLTYAQHYVRANVQREYFRSGRVIVVPRNSQFTRGLGLIRSGHATSPEQLATLLNSRPATAAFIWAVQSGADVAIDTGAAERWCVEHEHAEGRLSREECRAIAIRDVQEALARLPERWRVIAERRWMGEEDETLESIAADLGVSRQAVHQIEAKARARLRKSLAATWDMIGAVAA